MKILILSSHTPSLLWFRLDMMKDFIIQGHNVIAAGPDSGKAVTKQFQEFDIKYRNIFVNRNSKNIFDDLRTFQELYKLLKAEKPDKVFAYQAKTVVYGCLASRLVGIKEIYPMITGLGSIFRGKTFNNRIIKYILKLEYWLVLKFCSKVFLQNKDDKRELVNQKLVKARKIVLINGSGVNLLHYKQTPLPKEIAFLFVGRLIRDKGIVEYLKACRIIKIKYPTTRCMLVGPYDTNPTAITQKDLKPYIDDGIIEYYGEQFDVRIFYAQCSTFVLPSYHEGTPKTVLEAMAMGRSIITTDAPGCRETVIDGFNGFLIEPKDINQLISKMEILIKNPKLLKIMGDLSYKMVKKKYDVRLVNYSIMKTMGLL